MATLDGSGRIDGLPFMPEMSKFCGRTFIVLKRLERTCEEAKGEMRRIRNVVFLDDLRCDGQEHGGCQKGCRIFWKDDWLTGSDNAPKTHNENARENTSILTSLPSKLPSGHYVCQSTELVNASTLIRLTDVFSLVRDIQAKTYSIPALGLVLVKAIFLRIRYYLTGTSFRFLEGSKAHTPSASLGLQSGDWVRVKSREEIRETLDKRGMNRGLGFTVDMLPDCGQTFRVLRRLEKMIDESTRELIELKDTVILEGSICKGCYILKGGCPRENLNFWREIWLKRVNTPPAS